MLAQVQRWQHEQYMLKQEGLETDSSPTAMSTERAPSAVRNLRSLFETKSTDSSPDTRGRSTAGLATSDRDSSSRPTSRVRASFVAVEPPLKPKLEREGSATMSSNGVNGGEGVAEVKEQSALGIGSLDGTPNVDGMIKEPDESNGHPDLPSTPTKDARVQAGEEQSNGFHHADAPASAKKGVPSGEKAPVSSGPTVMTDKPAVSGAEATATPRTTSNIISGSPASPAKSVKSPAKSAKSPSKTLSGTKAKAPAKPEPVSRPSPISTSNSKPSLNSQRSPASQPKTPTSAKTPLPPKTESPRAASASQQKVALRKASRSSLTAPTASSVARAAAVEKAPPMPSKQSPPPKPKHREGTKPVELPSRLTAPTAASRARHESTPSTTTQAANSKHVSSLRTKPQTASARPTPRSSLNGGHRPESRSAHQQAAPRRAAPSDGSFLERMMRPTAASSSKTHEKTEAKSPPRTSKTTAPPAKAKTNGLTKKPAAKPPASRPGTAKSEKTVNGSDRKAEQQHEDAVEEEHAEDGPSVTGAGQVEIAGDVTPRPETNGHAAEALETTPAFGGEETLR